ncbi:MAG: hemerythrin domain-containing protein [Burkholderiaceae bacterium]
MQHTEHTQHKKTKSPAPHARKSPSKSAAHASKHDAISVLSEDHKHVQALFKQFEKLCGQKTGDNNDKKKELVQQICVELTIHAKAEEELFYPAARAAISDKEILEEAYVEHASAKELIQQLQSMHPGEDLYDAKVIVLGEYINHHIKEEEGQIFPAAKKAKMDLETLGENISQRKQELNADTADVSMSMLSKT